MTGKAKTQWQRYKEMLDDAKAMANSVTKEFIGLEASCDLKYFIIPSKEMLIYHYVTCMMQCHGFNCVVIFIHQWQSGGISMQNLEF